MLRLDFRAMACEMLAVLDSDAENAREALMQVPAWFAEWEESLSRFRAESELSALNGAEGKPVRVSETLWEVLEAAIGAANDSGGLVTPTLLDAVKAAGYDRSFELLEETPVADPAPVADHATVAEHVPVAEHAPAAEQATMHPSTLDWRAIERDPDTHTVRLPRGLHLDFGGVAKGWAADQAARRLSAIGPALIDAGGDIAVSGPRANGERWPIAVADPFDSRSDVALLALERGGVATSGRDYRRWKRNGQWQHHIIDPRTGAPADTDVLAATVIAPTTGAAEVAAKAALILGSRDGLEWIQARSELAGLLVLDDGQIIRSRRLDDSTWEPTRIQSGDPVLELK